MTTPATFTLGLEEARAIAVAAEPNPFALHDALDERLERQTALVRAQRAENRSLKADEQREMDKIDSEVKELRQLAGLARAGLAEKRVADDKQLSVARGPEFNLIHGSTRGAATDDERFGEAIRDAALRVLSGRDSSVLIDPTEHRSPEFRTITEGGDGGKLVPVDLKAPGFTLRAATVMLRLPGIRVVSVNSDRARFPRIGASSVVGVAEAGTLTEDNPDIDAVDVVTQKFGAIDYISSELVEDSEAPALSIIGQNLIEATARKLDASFLQGTGASDIVGIRNTLDINTTSVAATPADFDKFSDAIYAARVDNAEPRAWIMHPRTWNTVSKIKTGISSDKTTLLQPDPQREGQELLDLPVFHSTQITLTEGGGAGSWVAALDPSQIIITERRAATVEVSRDFKFDEDRIAIRVLARYGLGVLNPEGVSILTDVRA